MSSAGPSVSVVVPAYREAPNLRPLCERIFAATHRANLEAELIIVDDDSRDGSVEVVRDLASRFDVRIVVRTDQRGLASAVLRGFDEARGRVLLVMDADLQHPPEKIPELIECITSGRADFAIGSRYAGGRIERDWPLFRRLNSWVATLLARPLTTARDSMSGFFALHRDTWKRAAPLDPIGYKIGLELMVKARCRRCLEVPIVFGDRAGGQSKLNLSEQLRYLRHLARLYRFRFFTRP
ncbi:MAG TPA: polyprenol monophosphomannose synthase [Phycisphaerae bacterium]|nr:polyprenol monophosphomannose synthase [Phycisphaerae bacterium]